MLLMLWLGIATDLRILMGKPSAFSTVAVLLAVLAIAKMTGAPETDDNAPAIAPGASGFALTIGALELVIQVATAEVHEDAPKAPTGIQSQ